MADMAADSYPIGQAPWETGGASNAPPMDSFPVGQAPWETGAKSDSPAPASAHDQTEQSFNDMNEAGNASNDALFDTLTAGHLPQIKAKVKQLLNGEGIANNENYVKRRDQEIADIKARADKYPADTLEGKIAGFIAPMLLTGGASGVAEGGAAAAAEGAPAIAGAAGDAIAAPAVKQGFIKAAAKGSAIGAGMGAAQNPGDTPGVVDPLQLEARKNNAETGAVIGGAVGGLTSKIPDAADWVKDYSEKRAVSASGAMLKDFRKAYATDSVNDLGRFALDNKLVGAGDTYGKVAEKAGALREQTGEALGAGYDAGAKVLASLGPEASAKVEAAGFNPVRDKQAILDSVKGDLGYAFKGKAALKGVSDYLDDLAEQHGDQVLNPKVTNQIKTSLDKSAINWEKNPLAREPDSEAALKSLRGILADKVNAQVGAMGEAIGNPEAAKNLAALNSKYGMSSKIERMAADRENRELANAAFGLKEGAGAAVGIAAGSAIGGPVGALVGPAVGAAGARAARTYGPAIVASGANKAAQVLERVPQLTAAQQANPAVYKAITGNSSLTGPAKWANDGHDKLLDHAEDNPGAQKLLEKNKGALLADPKTKQLLIQASDLKPGSKAMDAVMAKIKSKIAAGD